MDYEISFGQYRYAHMRSEAPVKEDFAKHAHNLYEILFLNDGNHECVIDGRMFKLTPGDLLLIPPGTFHFINILADTAYERCVINFGEDNLSKELLNKVFCISRQFKIPAGSEILNIFKCMDNYSKLFKGGELESMSHAKLTELLLNISKLEDWHIAEHTYVDPFIAKVLKYIDDNFTVISGIEEIAEHMFISKSHLWLCFKKVMGVSPMQYINSKRILYAQSLLQTGQTPMRIYSKCGFKDYSAFYRSYRKFIGSTPSKIRGN